MFCEKADTRVDEIRVMMQAVASAGKTLPHRSTTKAEANPPKTYQILGMSPQTLKAKKKDSLIVNGSVTSQTSDCFS